MSANPDPPRDIAGLAVVGTVARALAPPVVILLLTGLAAATRSPLAIDAESAAHVTTVPLRELASPGILLTPLGVLTVAFVLLACAPMLTVPIVMVALARGRQWREAAIAAGVLVVLGLSVILRHH